MPVPPRLLPSACGLAAFAALAAPAGARSYVDPTPRPEPRAEPHLDDDERPDEIETAPPGRPDEPWRPVDYLSERWRLAAGVGARFGSFLVDNAGVGTVIPGHLDAGWRKGRLWLFAEYSLMSLTLPEAEQVAHGVAAPGHGRGLVHRLGGNARWSFSRLGCRDAGFDLYVEGGLGTQVLRWDAGGVWSRPDLALGLGAAGWGAGRREHGGLGAGLRIHLARRHDAGLGPVACGGPCDAPTRPTRLDRFYTGQFGGDARPDVVVYDACAGELRVLVNNGSGGLTGPFATVDPLAGWKLIAGDFVGDALTDVVLYYEGDGSIFVGRNAIFGFVWAQWASVEPDPIGSGAPPWQLYPGEFTNEGKLDILAYRPGTPGPPWGSNTRVGRNTGSSFTMESWSSLPATNVTPVVAHFTGTSTADVGIHTSGLPFDFGETYPDFKVLRNANQTFLESLNWTNSVPEDDLWQYNTGNFIATGTSASIVDLFAYYPGDGTFWVAENRGLPPEGYAWPLSVAPGETLNLYTSGTLMPGQPNVTFQRITADAQGTLVAEPSPTASITAASVHQRIHAAGVIPKNGPQWSPNIAFTIPSDWPTGFYAANLKAQNGPDYRITFVVKPRSDARHRTALIANINTWNSYNGWGATPGVPGYKYAGAAQTTFMRPNPAATLFVGMVAPPFDGTHLAHAEVWALSAIESITGVGRGNVDVYTDLDFHNGVVQAGTGAGQYDRLILSTHPEYWTTQMYDQLRLFLDRGGRVLYLGGNGLFEVAAYSMAPLGGQALTFLGGIEGGTGSAAQRTPYLFRIMGQVNGVPPRAERALLGVATMQCYPTGSIGAAPYVVKPHPTPGTYERSVFNALLEGVVSANDTNRTIGATGVLGGASGHEVDKLATVDSSGYVTNQVQCGFPSISEKNTMPAGVVRLAEGTNSSGGADITFYRYPDPPGTDPGGGFVFSVGSVNFGQSLILDPKLKQLVKNALTMN